MCPLQNTDLIFVWEETGAPLPPGATTTDDSRVRSGLASNASPHPSPRSMTPAKDPCVVVTDRPLTPMPNSRSDMPTVRAVFVPSNLNYHGSLEDPCLSWDYACQHHPRQPGIIIDTDLDRLAGQIRDTHLSPPAHRGGPHSFDPHRRPPPDFTLGGSSL